MTIQKKKPQSLRVLGVFCVAALAAASVGCEPAQSGEQGSTGAQLAPEQPALGGAGRASKDAPGAPEPGDGSELIALRAEVRDLSQAEVAALAVGDVEITVKPGAPRALREFQPGEVLIYRGEGGFWRAIEDVSRAGEQVIYRTRKATIGEVIERGTITLQARPSRQAPAAGGSARRAEQALKTQVPSGVVDLVTQPRDVAAAKAFDTYIALDTSPEFQFSNQTATLQTTGHLDFRPGFILVIDVANGGIERVEFAALGHLDIQARMSLKLNEGQPAGPVQPQVLYREIPLCSGDPGHGITCEDGRPTFVASLLGQPIKVFPHLRAGFAWEGSGSGTLSSVLEAQGHIKAGYAYHKSQENRKIYDEGVVARANRPRVEGAAELDYKMSLELGMTASLNGDELLVAYPFEGIYSADASTTPPACGVSSALELSGRVIRSGFLGSDVLPLYQNTPMKAHFPLDLPGCSVDTTATARTCTPTNPTCDEGQVCNQGYCIEDAALQFVLNWSDASADLDLIVERPGTDQYLLASGSGDAQPATDGWMAVKSCAGVCDGPPEAGRQFTEVALFRLPQEGHLYRFWVRNNTPALPGGAEAQPVPYTVYIISKGRPDNAMTSSIPGITGSESLRYVYTHAPIFDGAN